MAATQEHVRYYHATDLDAAESIAAEGFRAQYVDEDFGVVTRGGNLGAGIYVSCDWRTALWYGPVLLRVSLRRGTRILDAGVPPDPKVLRYLVREFGKDILKRPPRKVLPSNKKLSLPELKALFRHHYREGWVKPFARFPFGPDRPRRSDRNMELLDPLRSHLIRYGYDGYGVLRDENGIVVFAGERVEAQELVAELPRDLHDELNGEDGDFAAVRSLDHLRALFRKHGSPRGRRVAERIRDTPA